MGKGIKTVFFLTLFFTLGIMRCVALAHEDTREIKTGTVAGQVMLKGDGPMAGGMVYFFNETAGPPPSATMYWRVPGEAFGTDGNGRFVAEMPEGRYYMGAIRKKSGEPVGPPGSGDPFFVSQDEKGKPRLYNVLRGTAIDVGILEATPFNSDTLAKEGLTAIEGTVRDVDGKPVEGILVFAFTTQTIVGRPLFVSDRTGKDGKYRLRVAEGGTYYLRLRENYGGGPLRDSELKGVYGDKEPASALVIKSGEILKDINIKAMRFQGRGPKASYPGRE